ncbi:MAG: amino acid permease [Puniceicoccales bacterium]|jgi:aromatic amino acid transport protein AroP|nr:amino acid permease [Puniceicoccales bacterium]
MELRRDLGNRHIQLIALGGAIGTGLFLGSAGALKNAGPSLLLCYVIGGLVELLIMRQLGEMIVEEPVAGSFAHFAHKYWGGFAGFMSGWNYWMLYVLVGMTELTAVAKYMHYWAPSVPQWAPVLVFFALVNAVNFANVRIFGETEFWFALVKVIAVVCMIALGGWLLLSGGAGEEAAVSNLWQHGGFFAGDFADFSVALAFVMFSFGGLELVGVSAAETSDPGRTIPRAIKRVLLRILIFYIGAVAVMLMLAPWTKTVEAVAAASVAGAADAYAASPFVLILAKTGIPGAAHILNFVILTAALSVYNSGVYCNSRMLYGLAQKGSAPRSLASVNKRGVPTRALTLSAAATGLAVVVNYAMPAAAFEFLISLVVAALVLNWALISLTHLRFRTALRATGATAQFPAPWSPWANWVCVAFNAWVLFVLVVWAGKWKSALALVVWLALLIAAWAWRRQRR